MAKPVKKENEEIIPQQQVLIIPEELKHPTNHGKPEVFISQLQKLEEAKAVLNTMQEETEDGILKFLYKKFISKYPGGFMAMLAINYNWPERLLEKHSGFLTKYLLEDNYNLFIKNIKNINYDLVQIASKTDMLILRKKYEDFEGYWDDLFLTNSYWSEKTVKLYKSMYEDWAVFLSKNKEIDWNKEILNAFAENWDYEELLKNWSLPWSEELLEFISEIYAEAFEDAVLEDDYDTENLVVNMNGGFNLWDRISNDRYHQIWSFEFINDNKEKLNWELLSKNPSLPFTLDLFEQFLENWDMGNASGNFGVWENPSLFEKVFRPLLNDAIVEKIIKRYY